MRSSSFFFKLLISILVVFVANAPASSRTAADDGCTVPIKGLPSVDLEDICSLVLEQLTLSATEKAEAYYARGYAKVHKRKYDSAIDDFEIGLELAPNLSKLHRQLGYVYYRKRKIAKALDYANRAVDLNPEDSKAHSLLAMIYYLGGRPQKALQEFNITIRLDPENIWARYGRASLYLDHNDYKSALADSQWLMNRKPSALMGFGTIQKYHEKVELYDAVQIDHAFILMGAGRRDEAEKVLNRLVETNRTAIALFSRAQLLSRMPWGMGLPFRVSEATPDFEAAVKLVPENTYFWHSFASHLHFLNENEKALEAINTAVATFRFREELADVAWKRALILRSLGRTDEAIEEGINTMAFAMTLPRWVHKPFFDKFRRFGYWQSADIPTGMNREIEDATTACFLDRDCG